MKLTILGSNSAFPIFNRYPSSQLLDVNDRLYLIDCGEGTLFKLDKERVKKNKIKALFISHLHGDHYYGLMGLLSTMSLNQRKSPLTIVAPAILRDIIELNMKASNSSLNFEINYIYTHDESMEQIYEDNCVSVRTIPLHHKIPTTGFLFDQKFPNRKILSSKIETYGLEGEEIKTLTQGGTVEKNDRHLNLEDISIPIDQKKQYAYCSDTRYFPDIVSEIRGVDVLYHEATFMENEKERAKVTLHSTAMEAAQIAKEAQVHRLIIGHYSSRYENLKPLLEEAKSIFPNTELAEEHKTYLL